MTQRHLLTLADCSPGSVVRLETGLHRICSLSARGERWCRLVDAEGHEGEPIWVSERLPVLEVLADQSRYASSRPGEEIDPVQGRLR